MLSGLTHICHSWPLTWCVCVCVNVGDVDFGVVGIGLTPEEQRKMPDVVTLPMMSYSISCGYNVSYLLL